MAGLVLERAEEVSVARGAHHDVAVSVRDVGDRPTRIDTCDSATQGAQIEAELARPRGASVREQVLSFCERSSFA